MHSKKIFKCDAFLLVCIFLSGFILFYVNNIILFNADHLYYIASGRAISEGNIFLNGWYGSTNNFYLFSLIYAIGGKIFGFSPDLLCIISSLMWTCLISAIAFIIVEIYKKVNFYEKLLRVLSIYAVAFLSSYFTQSIRVLSGYHIE